MRWFAAFFTVGLCCALSVATLAADTGPFESLKSFSDFQQVDLNRLLNGDILSERGSLMDFANAAWNSASLMDFLRSSARAREKLAIMP